MPCEVIKLEDGTIVHICGGHRSKKLKCKFCGQAYRHGRQCDYPILGGRTCDAMMCDKCSTTGGKQKIESGHGGKIVNDTVDYCPNHKEAPRSRLYEQQSLFTSDSHRA